MVNIKSFRGVLLKVTNNHQQKTIGHSSSTNTFSFRSFRVAMFLFVHQLSIAYHDPLKTIRDKLVVQRVNLLFGMNHTSIEEKKFVSFVPFKNFIEKAKPLKSVGSISSR